MIQALTKHQRTEWSLFVLVSIALITVSPAGASSATYTSYTAFSSAGTGSLCFGPDAQPSALDRKPRCEVDDTLSSDLSQATLKVNVSTDEVVVATTRASGMSSLHGRIDKHFLGADTARATVKVTLHVSDVRLLRSGIGGQRSLNWSITVAAYGDTGGPIGGTVQPQAISEPGYYTLERTITTRRTGEQVSLPYLKLFLVADAHASVDSPGSASVDAPEGFPGGPQIHASPVHGSATSEMTVKVASIEVTEVSS